MALSADGRAWLLINASPDLRAQVEAFPALHPSPEMPRNSPLAAVLLTNADLDHVLGLFLLREGGSLRLHCPAPVFEVLQRHLRLPEILEPFCRVEWRDVPAALEPLVDGLRFRAIALGEKPPPFAAGAPAGTQSVAYEIVDERTLARLVVAPDVAVVTPDLRDALLAADAVLFDGTFWSADEMAGVTGGTRTAADMGHLPVRGGSLEALRGLKARHKVYLHVNNTNPILDPRSPQRAEVERAGVIVGEDGMEFEL